MPIDPANIISIKEVDINKPTQEQSQLTTEAGVQPIEQPEETQESATDEGANNNSEGSSSSEPSAGSEETPTPNAQGEGGNAEQEDFWSEEEVSDLAQQVTNGEFANFEELYSKYKDLEKKSSAQVDPLLNISDFSKKLIEFEKNGGDPKRFAELSSFDTSKMEPKEILFQKFLNDNPSLDKKSAEKLFNYDFKKQYGILGEEDASEEDKEIAQIKLNQEVSNASKNLDKWKTESLSIDKKHAEPQVDPQAQEFYKNHINTVNERISNFNGLQIPVSEKESDDFKYIATPEIKSKVKEWMEDPFGKFLPEISQNEKGEIDYERFEQAATILADPMGFIKKLVGHGMSIGQEGIVAKRKNQTTPITTPVGNNNTRKPSANEQLLNQWLAS
jgi:hypothetical protein